MTQWIKRSFVIAMAFAMFGSCMKPPEPEGSPDPVFYVNGSPEGEGEFVVKAGQFGVYMHTGIGSDSIGVPYFFGVVGQKDTSKGEYMEFRFRALQKQGEKPNPNNADIFHLGRYDLFASYREKPSDRLVEFTFFPSDIGSPVTSYHWNIDGINYSTNIPIVTIDTVSQDNVAVVLSTQFTSGCTSIQESHLMSNRIDDHVEISYSLRNKGFISFLADVPPGFNKIDWMINDVKQGSGPNSIVQLVPGTTLKVMAIASNGSGMISETRSFEVIDSNLVDYCHADFTTRDNSVMVEDVEQFGTVEILYRNKQGKIFTSRNVLEPGYVDILKIEEYIKNGDGIPTKKLTLEGNFHLKAQDGTMIHFGNFTGVIAVAY